jgi:DNA-binding transcriptional LysR family regulator
MNIEDLKLLIDIARHLSFAKVARLRNLDPSFVSRSVSQHEAELGFTLFHRNTRNMSITDAGRRYIKKITPLIEELEAAQNEVKNQQQAPSGTVRLTTSTAFGHEMILPLIEKFNAALPEINLELHLTDQMLDLVGDQIDLAIRLTDQPKGDFLCTKLLDTEYKIVSATEKQVELERPQDLAELDCPLLDLPNFKDRWIFKRRDEQIIVPVHGRTMISNPLALREAVRLGLGPTLLPDWLIKKDIKAGRLNVHFPDWQVTATSFHTAAWLLYPQQKFLPARLRATIDFFKQEITA